MASKNRRQQPYDCIQNLALLYVVCQSLLPVHVDEKCECLFISLILSFSQLNTTFNMTNTDRCQFNGVSVDEWISCAINIIFVTEILDCRTNWDFNILEALIHGLQVTCLNQLNKKQNWSVFWQSSPSAQTILLCFIRQNMTNQNVKVTFLHIFLAAGREYSTFAT